MPAKKAKKESVSAEMPTPAGDRFAALRELFPEAFAEGKLDLAKLRDAAGEIVDDRAERYSFSWAGKRDAIRLLQTPSRATLIPCPDESVNWDTTQNLFIEGENLEVLKLLYKSYSGRVNLIYIDPPYNTGEDFIYPDNFADPLDTYLKLTGQKDANGNLLTSNPETNGRYHSTWLSMMYPRLFLARQLLANDGVIFISIDDFEVRHLRLLLDEIFGEENFLAQLVWEKGRKNDAKLFSVGHEYLVVYARSKALLRQNKTIWREEKPGAKEIWEQYLRLRQMHGDDDKVIETDLTAWFSGLPKNHPSKRLSRYHRVDRYGPWRDRDISWPGGGGPDYDVPHPKTKQPCKVPADGWRFSTSEEMQRQIRLGLVEFRDDHTEPPFRKAHIKSVPEELLSDIDDETVPLENGQEDDEELATQVMPSVIYKQSQVAVKYLKSLLGGKLFDNPKDHEVLARVIRYVLKKDEPSIVLDFFAGSGSSAHGVLDLISSGHPIAFIAVQLPEPTRRKKADGTYHESAAWKAGFKTIADLCKERIRRAIKSLDEENSGKLPFAKSNPAIGVRCFRLAASHNRQWSGIPDRDTESLGKQMALFIDPLLPGWKPLPVIHEVAMREGYSLSCRVEELPKKATKPNTVYRVTDPEKDQAFRICLDDKVSSGIVKALELGTDDLFVCRDVALNDETAANLALQCRLKTI